MVFAHFNKRINKKFFMNHLTGQGARPPRLRRLLSIQVAVDNAVSQKCFRQQYQGLYTGRVAGQGMDSAQRSTRSFVTSISSRVQFQSSGCGNASKSTIVHSKHDNKFNNFTPHFSMSRLSRRSIPLLGAQTNGNSRRALGDLWGRDRSAYSSLAREGSATGNTAAANAATGLKESEAVVGRSWSSSDRSAMSTAIAVEQSVLAKRMSEHRVADLPATKFSATGTKRQTATKRTLYTVFSKDWIQPMHPKLSALHQLNLNWQNKQQALKNATTTTTQSVHAAIHLSSISVQSSQTKAPHLLSTTFTPYPQFLQKVLAAYKEHAQEMRPVDALFVLQAIEHHSVYQDEFWKAIVQFVWISKHSTVRPAATAPLGTPELNVAAGMFRSSWKYPLQKVIGSVYSSQGRHEFRRRLRQFPTKLAKRCTSPSTLTWEEAMSDQQQLAVTMIDALTMRGNHSEAFELYRHLDRVGIELPPQVFQFMLSRAITRKDSKNFLRLLRWEGNAVVEKYQKVQSSQSSTTMAMDTTSLSSTSTTTLSSCPSPFSISTTATETSTQDTMGAAKELESSSTDSQTVSDEVANILTAFTASNSSPLSPRLDISEQRMDNTLEYLCDLGMRRYARKIFFDECRRGRKYRTFSFNTILNSYSTNDPLLRNIPQDTQQSAKSSFEPSEALQYDRLSQIASPQMIFIPHQVVDTTKIGDVLTIMEHQGVMPNIHTLNILTKLFLEMKDQNFDGTAGNSNGVPHWQEAFTLYNPNKITPNTVTFTTLLSHYSKHRDIGMMRRIYDAMAVPLDGSGILSKKERNRANRQLFKAIGAVQETSGDDSKSEDDSADAFEREYEEEQTTEATYLPEDTDADYDQSRQNSSRTTVKPPKSMRNIWTYNIMLHALLERATVTNDIEAIGQCFHDMEQDGISADVVTYSINMMHHLKRNDLVSAMQVFQNMSGSVPQELEGSLEDATAFKPENVGAPEPDMITYTMLIGAYGRVGNLDLATALFQEMTRRGMTPNLRTYSNMMDALYQEGEFETADQLWNLVSTSSRLSKTEMAYMESVTKQRAEKSNMNRIKHKEFDDDFEGDL